MAVAFSVIVPVYEMWHLIPGLLAALGQQSIGSDQFEVLLADNGSSHFDPPAELPQNVRIIHCTQPGSYAARNAAAAEASGEWLAFTDSDCLPKPDWLAALWQEASRHAQPAVLVGAVDMFSSPRPNSYEIYDLVRGIPQQRYARHGYGATANLAVPRTVFQSMSGFDARRFSGGDAEFCRRAAAAGAMIVYVDAARVRHPARNSWPELAIKSRRILGGQLRVGSPRARAYRLARLIVPPIVAWWRFLHAPYPLRYRLVAAAIQTRLWGVELLEAVRLMTGRTAERR